ncbi:MAG: type I glyceraldehyde-3-phosphate dehydrogenase [Myxococcota bacterium]
MAIKIGINGFGRIGRAVARIASQDPDVDIVAINDLTSADQLAYLFKYDTVHGRFGGEVHVDGNKITIDGDTIEISAERDPAALNWGAKGADYVLECTGIFRKRDDAAKHLTAGAKKVLISAPGKGVDMTVVMGVNHEDYAANMEIIDVASCTTNCLAPIAKVLHDSFGIEHGLMTTIHSYTNDQSLLDAPHSKDFRRARAAAQNIVPTSTGAAIAVTRVLPELEGKLDGMAMRVPTPNVSCVDLVARLGKNVTVDDVHHAMKNAAEGELAGVLGYTDEPVVSSDMMTQPESSVYDAQLTSVIGGNLAKVISWYDNEWGYSSRMVDVLKYIATVD